VPADIVWRVKAGVWRVEILRPRAVVLMVLGVVIATQASPAAASVGRAARRCGVPAVSRSPSPWPSMRRDRYNTGAGTIMGKYRGDRPWSFATGAGLFTTPVLGGNGIVYFGSADHDFYALTPRGKLCWKLQTGNIIDAAAALDRSQRTVTIGSADEYLYHLSANPSAHRRVIWRYHATLPPVPGQLVDWWEDNIAYGPDGNIYTGNTGGVVYSFTPQGQLRWTFRGAGNSVWTMPAFGSGGTSFWGSVDRSVYALNSDGSQKWSTPTLGFVISSPAIGSNGTIYIGSFDSKLYALDPGNGRPKWTFGTNDHIYSSPALGHDAHGNTDAIYIASTDGSVYAITPAGKLLWAYDTGEPIRSSPVLGPARSRRRILYVGSSDGSLYALDAATGRRRWSFNTVSSGPILRDRHELNSSPALGRTGAYIGSEDGHLWYVPYDYCLHRADSRCNTDRGSPYPSHVSRVLPVTAGGTTERSGAEGHVPSSSEITGRLLVRRGGGTVYASMLPAPAASALVHAKPTFSFTSQLSGDGRYIFVVPRSFLTPSTTFRLSVSGKWGAGGARVANYTTPGTWTQYGSFADSFSFRTSSLGGPLPLRTAHGQVSAFVLRRLAVPLPAFLPSVNQIGFDSYVLLVGAVSVGRPNPARGGTGSILLWATQARRGPHGTYLADPHGTLVFPLAGYYRGSTLMLSAQGATLTFSFGKVPLQRLDVGVTLDRSLHNRPGANLYAEAVCADIPNYGPVAYLTGQCNTNGILPAAGTFITDRYRPGSSQARTASATPVNIKPPGLRVSSLSIQRPTAATAGSVTTTLARAHGARYRARDHRVGMLLLDQHGRPLGIDYTAQTTATDSRGNVAKVTLLIPAGTSMPTHLTAYVTADVFPLVKRQLY
jgi:outer membrane protein assembly factor BamB